jgi:crossover junction endodeoxyribonuclease RuvC
LRILGIDPGTYKMGVGVMDADSGELGLVQPILLSPPRKDSLAARLYHLYDKLVEIIGEWKPSEVAIEEPFVSRNVRAAMAIGQAQAVAMVAAARSGLPVSTYSPREVKRSVTDYGGSSKEQVHEMVRVLLGLSELPGPSDVSDALAVAICHAVSSQARELVLRE